MKTIERISIYSVLVVLFVLSAIFDFQIAQALYHPDNIIGRLGEMLGEVPLYMLGTFGIFVLTLFHPSFGKKWDRVILILGILFAVGVSFYGGHHTIKLFTRAFYKVDMNSGLKWALKFVVAGAIFGLSFLGTRAVRRESRNEAVCWGLLLLLMVVISLALMQGLKMIWLRPRYRTLVALEGAGYANATTELWLPFYHPQFFTSFKNYKAGGSWGITETQINSAMSALSVDKWEAEEFYAFPSGHTMNTFVTVSICFFPRFMFSFKKDCPKFEIGARIFIALFTLFIAFTRVLRGAHHATDVLAGFLLAVISFDLTSTFFYERFIRQKVLPKMDAALAKAE